MRKLAFVLTAGACAAIAGGALAQQRRSDVAIGFINRCVAPLQSEMTNPEPGCACVLGHMSVRMSDRQLAIAGRLMPKSAELAELNAEIAALRQDGYTTRDIATARRVMNEVSATMEATCQRLFR